MAADSFTGFEVRLCVRIPEDPVNKARDWVRLSGRYDNLSHYVRAAIVRLNNAHESGDISLNYKDVKEGVDEE